MNQHHEDNLKEKQVTNETRIEGVGTVRSYGQLDIEKLVKRLLKAEYIVGQ